MRVLTKQEAEGINVELIYNRGNVIVIMTQKEALVNY